MKLMTYNLMVGGVEPKPSRLEQVLYIINEQNADIVGLQETKLAFGSENELVYTLRNKKDYPYDQVIEGVAEDWMFGWGASLFSRKKPSSSRRIGKKVRAVEMTFPVLTGELSICNVYLSHVNESLRLPQIQEVLQELQGQKYSILMGDFNSLSPEDGIPDSAINSFSNRMKDKYCRGGKLCYDTIEAVLEAGYIDIGLKFHKPEEITDKAAISWGTGNHTRPVRIDFIFATESVLSPIKEFEIVNNKFTRLASDHFPLYAVIDNFFGT